MAASDSQWRRFSNTVPARMTLDLAKIFLFREFK